MVNWRNLEAGLDRKVGRAFGESVRLSPMRGDAPDPERPQIIANGVLCVEEDAPVEFGSGKFHTDVTASQSRLLLDRATYSGPRLAKGDKVRAMERAGEPVFRVSRVSDRHSNLIIVFLGDA